MPDTPRTVDMELGRCFGNPMLRKVRAALATPAGERLRDALVMPTFIVTQKGLEAAAKALWVSQFPVERPCTWLELPDTDRAGYHRDAAAVLTAAGGVVADEVGVLRIDTEGRAYVWNDVDGDQPIADHSTIAILEEEAHGKEEE